MTRFRAFVLAVAIGLAAVVFASPAAAQTGTLAGETLVPTGDFTATTVDCNPEGATVVFTATGRAEGPYPGTYEETVTVTTGPLFVIESTDIFGDPIIQAYGQVATLTAEFTIVSGETVITGTKELTAPEQTTFYCKTQRSAECNELALGIHTEGEALTYDAAIGGRSDSGTSDLDAGFPMAYECGGYIDTLGSGGLNEFFLRSFTPAYTFADVCALAREFAATPHGANGLCAKLSAAEASAARGDTQATRGELGAFANQVRALTGVEFTSEEAKTLLAAAALLPGQ